MKIALYIEDGLEQLVLTPENKHERGLLKLLDDKTRKLSIYHGSFYSCKGGWIRQEKQNQGFYPSWERDTDDESTIIVLNQLPKNKE